MPTDYNTAASLASASVPGTVAIVQLLGYYSIGDGAGHLRRRGINVPSAIQSADGAYWEYLSQNNEYDIRHFGARVDGGSDDTNSINLAIGALPRIAGSYSTASSPRLYFPAGRTITQGGHLIPSDKKCRVIGDGSYTSVIQVASGYSGTNDVITIASMHSSVENVMVEGNRTDNTGVQDAVVVNAAFVRVFNVRIASMRGSGLVVGKTASGINVNVAMVDVRFCMQYGVNIVAGGSTDGAWANVNVGASGYSGFNVGTGAQKMVNCHSWGNGLESASDNSGFNIRSGANMMSSCEAESNLGDGITIRASVRFNAIVGSTIWGNCNRGIYIFGGSYSNTIAGCSFRNNGVKNINAIPSATYAHIALDGCNYNVVTGNSFDDDASALVQPSYNFPTSFPYPGRASGTRTSSLCYAEINASDYNTVSGNEMQASRTTSGSAVLPAGYNGVFGANSTGEIGLVSIASASTVSIPANVDLVRITGTAGITSVQAASRGRRLTLIFQSAGVVVTNGGNLLIGSNYTSTAGSSLTIISDGANWYRG